MPLSCCCGTSLDNDGASSSSGVSSMGGSTTTRSVSSSSRSEDDDAARPTLPPAGPSLPIPSLMLPDGLTSACLVSVMQPDTVVAALLMTFSEDDPTPLYQLDSNDMDDDDDSTDDDDDDDDQTRTTSELLTYLARRYDPHRLQRLQHGPSGCGVTGMSRNHNKEKYETPNPRRSHTIMSQEDVAQGRRSRWPELEITGTIRNLSPQLWAWEHLTSLYLNDNCLSRIPPDIAKLTQLQHLDLSSNKLRSLPAEIGDLIYLRELLLNNNHLRVLPYEIGKLFQLQALGLKGNPLAPEIQSVYGEPNGTHKLLSYLLDNLAVTTTHPPQRPWIPLAHPNRSRPNCIFTVMCYNVLCDKYATRQMYGYCPSWALDWEYRKKGILEEIRQFSADIISLQEVETDQFYNFFLPELRNEGYDGIFSPKSRAKTMTESERKYVDGCAIFFRTSKFTLIKEHLVEFNQLAMANADGSDDMLNRVMTKDNIGLAALLQTKEAAWDSGPLPELHQMAQPLLVCTAHIHWDPEFCDVKLIQTMMLVHELKQIIEDAGHSFRPGHKADPNAVQLLLCGDFNSLPDSGVIDFLSHGHISATHPDFKDLGYKSCLQKVSMSEKPNEYTHAFKLSSAYAAHVMPYTNFTFDFKGVIDYIFYSRQSMNPLGLLGPLAEEWLSDNKVAGCPHPHVPSDHFSLLVELEMTPTLPPPSNGLIPRR